LAAAFNNKDEVEFLAVLIRVIWPKIPKADSEIDAQHIRCHGKTSFLYPFDPAIREWFARTSSISEDPDHPRVERPALN
jgi:hypothetical protein